MTMLDETPVLEAARIVRTVTVGELRATTPGLLEVEGIVAVQWPSGMVEAVAAAVVEAACPDRDPACFVFGLAVDVDEED